MAQATKEKSKPMIKPLTAQEAREELMRRLRQKAKLDSWNSYVETLKVPGDIVPAMQTGRHELMKLVPARELSEAECRVLYDLIGGLIETNAALRQHAEEVSHLVDLWSQAFAQLRSLGGQIQSFAKFQEQIVKFANFDSDDDE